MKDWKNRKASWKRDGNRRGSMRSPDPGEPEKWHAYILDGEARLEQPVRAEMRGYVDGSPRHILSFKWKKGGDIKWIRKLLQQ